MPDVLAGIENKIVKEGIVLWWLGGSSWVMKTPIALLYVDLFTGPAPKEALTPLTKNYADLISPGDVSKADLVLCTHEHIDHCHQASLVPIYQNTQAIFIGGPSSAKCYRGWGFEEKRIVELRPHQGFQRPGIDITALPSKDCVDVGAVAYLIQSGGIAVFDGGDSLYFDGFKEIGQEFAIDIAMLNFFRNPPDSEIVLSMTPPEVARAAQDLGARVLIPKHWNIWKELQDDPRKVISYLEGSSIRVEFLSMGKEFEYIKG